MGKDARSVGEERKGAVILNMKPQEGLKTVGVRMVEQEKSGTEKVGEGGIVVGVHRGILGMLEMPTWQLTSLLRLPFPQKAFFSSRHRSHPVSTDLLELPTTVDPLLEGRQRPAHLDRRLLQRHRARCLKQDQRHRKHQKDRKREKK